MTIIFERRQINDRFLLVQFQFGSYDAKGNIFSLDKYIGLDYWSQIYTKLNATFEKYKTNVDNRLENETITMNRAQLELKLTWHRKQPYHREVANQEKKKCDLCPYVLFVDISAFSLVEKFAKKISQEKLATVKSSQSKTKIEPKLNIERKSNGSNTSNSIHTSNDDDEEYVPECLSENIVANLDQYIPSIASTSTEKLNVHSQEYTPLSTDTKSDLDQFFDYTPTKIEKSHKYKQKTTIKTDLNRNDYLEKKKRTETSDLFGDSDDNVERNGRTNLRSSKKTTQTHVDTPKQQSNLNRWVNTTRSRKLQPSRIDTNDASDDTRKKRKVNENSLVEVSNRKHSNDEDSRNKQTKKDQEAKMMRDLRAVFEAEERLEKENEVVIDEYYTLHNMSLDKIAKTWPQHEKALRQRYQKIINIPDHLIKASVPKDWDYLLILDILVTIDQQQHMRTKLMEMFFKNEYTNANHENLLWCWLIPEWALRIFMDKYMYTEEEAFVRLKQQDRAQLQRKSLDFIT